MGRQIIGTDDGDYGVTAKELRALAEITDKVEAVGPSDDVTVTVELEGLPYEARFGWDSTGTFGVLAAQMKDDES